MKDQPQKKEASSVDESEVLTKKFCVDCKTTKTPLWRVGPSGPKSLCNACGIRFRKKDTEILDLGKKERSSKSRSSRSKHGGVKVGEKSGKGKKLSKDLKVRLRGLALGKEVVLLKRRRSRSMRKHRKMGEVEQAALLLMALSCGSVSAQKQFKV